MAELSINYIKQKWQEEGFQKYFKNTGWIFVTRIVSMAISFFTMIYVVRSLGPTNYGQLSYAVSFISIFGFIAGLGIDNVLYRELINNPDKKREFMGSAIFLKIFAGIFTMFITMTFGYYLGHDDVSKILILILSFTFIFISFQVISYEFQAQVKSKYPSIVGLIVTIILNALKILVILSGKGVIYLALVLLLEPILYTIFYIYSYEKILGLKISDLSFDKSIATKLLSDSWPLIFTSAFALIYARIDQVLIKYMLGAESVGIYSSAVTVAEVWYFLPTIVVASFFPAIVNAKKVSNELYYERLKKLSIFLLILAIAISAIITTFAPLIMKLMFGQAFMGGSTILKIYVWATIGTFLGYLANNYLVAENHKIGLISITFIPMITNIILNLMWIPKFGIVGSAYATLISYSLGPISLLLFKDTRSNIINVILKK